jgi:hypothetical protein
MYMNVTCAGMWRCNGGIWWWDVVEIGPRRSKKQITQKV